MTPALVDWSELDHAALLALNNAHAVELSFALPDVFAALAAKAFYARGFAPAQGFLLAFDETAGIEGPNYAWFKTRHARFVYIDRVVIAASSRGLGLARTLYADLEAFARSSGHTSLAAEINSDPPNLASDVFHARKGFGPVGQAHLADRGKTVRYVMKSI